MKRQLWLLTIAVLAGSAFSAARAAPPDVKASPSTPVQVVNTTSDPVPVTLQGTGSITGDVRVNNTSADPVPVTGNVGITGTPSVSITGTSNVHITGGSVNVGTKIVASFEQTDLDSSQHMYGPFDISPYSKIRFSVVANGTGRVIADIETDGLGDYFSVDAGDRNTRVYEVAGTTATIFLNGDPTITQVFVKLFGS
jgi:hypothetical protein